MALPTRILGDTEVSSVSLGCMNLSHAYGNAPSPEYGERLIHAAFELGVNHFDTAILYGFGKNEALVGRAIKPFRNEIHLASKCGLTSPDLQRNVDGRPEAIIAACDESLRRLQTDVIDLYYLHRWDKSITIEDSMGAMKKLVDDGKIKAVGLCEVSANTLRKAHAVYPITAVQSEYSLWSRNPEIAVLDACKEIGAAFVAFSPLGRGFLTGTLNNPAGFVDKDLRNNMPRFQEPNYSVNLDLLEPLREVSEACGITLPQLALAWLLNKDDSIISIPGTTKIRHLLENCEAADLDLSLDVMERIEVCFDGYSVQGGRYNEKTQLEIDTEEF